MHLLNDLANRLATPAFLVNSLPKAGTHLVSKAVALYPGIRWQGLHIGRSHRGRFPTAADNEPAVPIGVDWPQPVPRSTVQAAFQLLKRGQFATAHLPYSKDMSDLLAGLNIRSVLIVRDPRDVVVSHANHIANSPHHFLYDYYTALAPEERLMASIRGVEPAAPDGPRMLSICERCRSVQPWMREPYNYTTRFERLVGPEAGGSQPAQVQELENIARHLAIRSDPGEAGRIASSVYGGTSTFRKGLKGQIGDWSQHFQEAHRAAFKEVAGTLLIELGYERDLDW